MILGTPTGVYATFVLTIVAGEDDSRVVWPSCPSSGWRSGVHALDAHPNGSPLGLNPHAKPPTIARAELGTAALLSVSGALAAPGACDGAPCNCTATPDMDIDGDGEVEPSASAAACCARCTSVSSCMGAVYVGASSECWIKYMGGTPVKSTQAGRLLVVPFNRSAGNAPLETHG